MARMNRINKLFASLSTAVLGLGLLSVCSEANAAEEIQLTGPLKNAPSVINLQLFRKGRFEFAPTFSATLLDEYRRTFMFGARLNYGITDWLGIGLWGAYGAVGVATNLADQIDEKAQRSTDPTATLAARGGLTQMNVSGNPNEKKFQDSQIARITYMVLPQITLVPFRGKFSLFESIFAAMDVNLFLGLGVVGVQERKSCNSFNECADPKNQVLESRPVFAPTWGFGLTFYLNKFISLGLEYRMVPFSWNRGGFDSRGADGPPGTSFKTDKKFPDQKINDEDRTWRFNQLVGFSIGFTFPTQPKIAR